MVIRHRCQEVALFSARVRRRAFLERLGIKGDLMSRFKRYIALDGVAARMARGAKLSSYHLVKMALQTPL